MKTVFQLTKNGTYYGQFPDIDEAKLRAFDLEGNRPLEWKELDESTAYALGHGETISRNEYEIRSFKRRE